MQIASAVDGKRRAGTDRPAGMSATEIGIETGAGITARSTPGMIRIGISLRASQSETPKDVRLASPQLGPAHHLLAACVHGASPVIVCSSRLFSPKASLKASRELAFAFVQLYIGSTLA